ncbi:MAG: hypothetical protein NVSMB24_27230 [Mucilaginibacter sp.]
MFLVMKMQSRNNKELSVTEVLQCGEVIQKGIKVNFVPYKDFTDLVQNGEPDFTMVEKLRGKMDEVHHRRDLKKAIYGEQVALGDDDVMKSGSPGAVFARNMVKDLSKHIRFSDDEQKTIEKF